MYTLVTSCQILNVNNKYMKQAETSMTWLQSTNSANFSNSATRLLNTIFGKMEAVAGIIYRWVISVIPGLT